MSSEKRNTEYKRTTKSDRMDIQRSLDHMFPKSTNQK